MKIKEIIALLFGILLAGWGLFITAGFILNVSDDKRSLIEGFFLILLIGAIPFAGGAWLIRWATSSRKRQMAAFQAPKPTEEMMERKILQLASVSKAKLSPSEVALKTHISLEKATELLNNMQEMGHAELQISPNGSVIYYFHGLVSDSEKENSSDIL